MFGNEHKNAIQSVCLVNNHTDTMPHIGGFVFKKIDSIAHGRMLTRLARELSGYASLIQSGKETMSTQDAATEQRIQVLGLTAPRVTKERIDSLMDKVVFVSTQPSGTTSTLVHAFLDGDFLLATGHSACVSKENFNAQLGFDMAKRNAENVARDKLWELEGYVLRVRLAS